MRLKTSVELQIPFHDVDMMDIVWHGHYAKYFEIARCALLDKLDYNYLQMRDSGYFWPVIDLHIRYVKPAQFGQWICVNAELVEWEYRLKIKYQLVDRRTQTRLTKGYSVQVAVDIKTQAMCFASPAVLLEKVQALECC